MSQLEPAHFLGLEARKNIVEVYQWLLCSLTTLRNPQPRRVKRSDGAHSESDFAWETLTIEKFLEREGLKDFDEWRRRQGEAYQAKLLEPRVPHLQCTNSGS